MDRPIVSMFTNLSWDSAVAGRRTIFASMLDWARETVRFAAGKDFTLVIRVHPSETLIHEGNRTREHVIDDLKKHFGEADLLGFTTKS